MVVVTRRQAALSPEGPVAPAAPVAPASPTATIAGKPKAAGFVNPVTTHFEFMGPHGTPLMVLGLPVATLGLYYLCPDTHCSITTLPARLPTLEELWDPVAAAVFLAWFALQALLYMLVPATLATGLPLRDGSVLTYRINAFRCALVTSALLFAGQWTGVLRLSYVYDKFVPLAVASILFSYALSLFLYVKAKAPGAMLAEGGNSGNVLYDFFIGHELNPRTGAFDWKYFCELRPGLIGWVVITVGMAVKQFELSGSVDHSLLLVVAFQAWYVFDALQAEKCILTTMDITTDGFGFMLAFGDLAWVPFTYSLQARYLVSNPQNMPLTWLAGIVALQFLGYYIFRGANGQKDAFRANPDDPALAHLKFITTDKGRKLLVSGWWGVARHINYFGDLLMALAWCLPCGFSSIIPYFYVIYFAILLIHRERRDDHSCHIKYGKYWEEYRQKVPYRIVPYLY